MSKVSALRKLIREEIKAALREELPTILKEHFNRAPQGSDYKKSLQESVKSKIPGTLNTRASNPISSVKFDKSNPLSSFLNETAASMIQKDFQYLGSAEDKNPTEFSQPEYVQTGTVSDMLQSATPSSALELVEIDTVPDFTGLMEKLESKGVI